MALHLLRRVTLRALASTSQVARNHSTVSKPPSLAKPSALFAVKSGRSPFATQYRRPYSTEQQDLEEEAKAREEQPAAGSEESAIGSAARSVSETAERAKDAVVSAVSSGFQSVTPDRPGRYDRNDRNNTGSRVEQAPSNQLYIGNLYFEVTEAALKREFSKFGTVTSIKIIYDGRGLSKGFGYVEFEDTATAVEARDALNGQVFEGRRLAVQYAEKRGDNKRRAVNSEGYTNAPSKTLFIGNMSYEMSDKDLNDLFRGIKNVLDVRVAIDRRTGQPRGFAHADFVDVKSAEDAAEFLKTKEFYGRSLKIDYSASSPSRREEGRDAARSAMQ